MVFRGVTGFSCFLFRLFVNIIDAGGEEILCTVCKHVTADSLGFPGRKILMVLVVGPTYQ